jgi:hypothetical protein
MGLAPESGRAWMSGLDRAWAGFRRLGVPGTVRPDVRARPGSRGPRRRARTPGGTGPMDAAAGGPDSTTPTSRYTRTWAMWEGRWDQETTAVAFGLGASNCSSSGVREACQTPSPTKTAMTAARTNEATAPHSMTVPISENP